MVDKHSALTNEPKGAGSQAHVEKPAENPIFEIEDAAIQVDGAIIAEGLAIEPFLLQERMREGSITSRCERGIGEDAGRYRLTFFTDKRQLMLVVDLQGTVLRRNAQNVRR